MKDCIFITFSFCWFGVDPHNYLSTLLKLSFAHLVPAVWVGCTLVTWLRVNRQHRGSHWPPSILAATGWPGNLKYVGRSFSGILCKSLSSLPAKADNVDLKDGLLNNRVCRDILVEKVICVTLGHKSKIGIKCLCHLIEYI